MPPESDASALDDGCMELKEAAAKESAEQATQTNEQAAGQAIGGAEVASTDLQLRSKLLAARQSHFVDLLPELKDLVYGFYTSDLQLIQLNHLNVPALAQVSQKIRKDFLKVFFKHGRFGTIIGPYLGTKYYRGRINGSSIFNGGFFEAGRYTDNALLNSYVAYTARGLPGRSLGSLSRYDILAPSSVAK